jgi:hypothetical protein
LASGQAPEIGHALFADCIPRQAPFPEFQCQRDRRVRWATWAGRQAPLEYQHHKLLERPRPFAVGQLRREQLPESHGKFPYFALQRFFPAGPLLSGGALSSWRTGISPGVGTACVWIGTCIGALLGIGTTIGFSFALPDRVKTIHFRPSVVGIGKPFGILVPHGS